MITKTKKGYVSSMDKENKSGKTIKALPQTGNRVSMARDRGRRAQMPGKRISKTGKVYWETRKDRSDNAFSSV